MANEIASAYIALYTTMPGVKNDIRKSLGGVDASAAGRGVGESFNAGLTGAIAGTTAAIVTKAIDMISNSLGSAISRVDTMSNFPKIMANLGYTSEEAADAIQTISTRLSGLPTAMDSMAGMVQQLAPLTGGLSEATDLSLALNNALLAGGKSTDIQANAMEQYTQMLAIGKVDMAAWRSMVAAMPGQMDQLAQSILGVDAKSMDLYASLQDGTVGFSDFNAAVLRLNSEGTGAYASFEQQARSATEGIATGQTNLNTAITRGLANVIAKFQPQITALLAGLTSFANDAFKALIGLFDWIAANKEWLTPIAVGIGIIVASVIAWNIVSKTWLGIQAIVAGVQAAYIASTYGMTAASYGYQGASKIATAAQWAFNSSLLASPITWIIVAIAALVAGLIWFFTQTEVGKAIWEGFTTALGTAFTWLWEGVLKPTFDAIGIAFTWLFNNIIMPVVTGIMIYIGLWAALFEWLWSNAIGPSLQMIGAAFSWLFDTIIAPSFAVFQAGMQAVGDVISWVYAAVIQPIFNAIGATFNWLWANAISPVTNLINNAMTTVGGTIQTIFGGISDFIGAAFNSVLGVVKGPINALIDLINGIIDGLNSISIDIPDWVPLVGGQHWGLDIPTIPRLAEGGIIKAQAGGILANIGEGRYDEAVVPLSPAVLGQLGGSGPVTQNNTFNMVGQDPRLVARQFGRNLKVGLA